MQLLKRTESWPRAELITFRRQRDWADRLITSLDSARDDIDGNITEMLRSHIPPWLQLLNSQRIKEVVEALAETGDLASTDRILFNNLNPVLLKCGYLASFFAVNISIPFFSQREDILPDRFISFWNKCSFNCKK